MLFIHHSEIQDCIQYNNNIDEVIDFCSDSFVLDETGGYVRGFNNHDIRVNLRDYIVKTSEGDFLVVPEEEFEKSHERIDL